MGLKKSDLFAHVGVRGHLIVYYMWVRGRRLSSDSAIALWVERNPIEDYGDGSSICVA